MSKLGNFYDTTTEKLKHSRKVWREIRSMYPAGGVIANMGTWATANKKVIPSGTPVKFDMASGEITAYLDTTITGAKDATTQASTADQLGINGFLQEDVEVGTATSKASGTVVYAGEIYDYMISSDVLTILKTLTSFPQIVFVH